MSEVTRILSAAAGGDQRAAEQLLPMVYDQLRQLAREHMRHERVNHTLEPTALVHEAYLRLLAGQEQQWSGRGHFFCAAAEAMRRILIEHARRKKALRHGGGGNTLPLQDDIPEITLPCNSIDELLDMDSALNQLEGEEPDKAKLVKLRCFAGLNLDEAAAVLQISRATAYRHWEFARAWLHQAMTSNAGND